MLSFKKYITSFAALLCLVPCFAQKKQHGKASYYSKKSTGARTASGQRLHHDSLTCAHRFYPFGTKLKVTNLNNNKSVVVKVIDRGPFGRGRIIDLSYAAAKEIGMIAQGIATVKVELMDNPIPYRPEDAKLPRMDFELAESDFGYSKKSTTKEQENSSNSNATSNHHKSKEKEESSKEKKESPKSKK